VSKQPGYSLDTVDCDNAQPLRGGVEKTLTRLEQNLLPLPEGADVAELVKHDGRLFEKKDASSSATLNLLLEKDLEAYRIGSMEPSAERLVISSAKSSRCSRQARRAHEDAPANARQIRRHGSPARHATPYNNKSQFKRRRYANTQS